MPGVGGSGLILALDVPTRSGALKLARLTSPHVSLFKVGSQLFTSEGPGLIADLRSEGHGVFLDLKFHDIPNTVARAAEAATGLGVDMYTLHASGGEAMMRAAVEATKEAAERSESLRPAVLAVTVLTSMPSSVDEVMTLVGQARSAGVDGVVASAREASAIREALGSEFLIVTPGIRPSWAQANDQKRIATPREAMDSGANYIVVGRPIREAADPREAARLVSEELTVTEVTG